MIDIIIINWNSGALLENCINSIMASDNIQYNIVVVDNNSQDNSLMFIQALPVKVTVIKNDINRGFGAACNQALKFCNSDYVLLLNPDTILGKDTLSKSYRFLEDHTTYAILGIKLLDENSNVSRHCCRYPKPIHFINNSLKLSVLLPKVFKDKIMYDWDHQSSAEVAHVMGAYMLIRRELINAIGFMDERYYVYLEDLDFSVRCINAGYKIYYNADIQAYHEGGGTSKNVKAKRLSYSLHSHLLFASKHFSKLNSITIRFFIIIVEPFIRLFFYSLKGSFTEVRETMLGYQKLFSKLMQKDNANTF